MRILILLTTFIIFTACTSSNNVKIETPATTSWLQVLESSSGKELLRKNIYTQRDKFIVDTTYTYNDTYIGYTYDTTLILDSTPIDTTYDTTQYHSVLMVDSTRYDTSIVDDTIRIDTLTDTTYVIIDTVTDIDTTIKYRITGTLNIDSILDTVYIVKQIDTTDEVLVPLDTAYDTIMLSDTELQDMIDTAYDTISVDIDKSVDRINIILHGDTTDTYIVNKDIFDGAFITTR